MILPFIDYFEYANGDILVISVSKYKDIPYSIVKNNRVHISWRQYYYRTSHGKRLISDQLLKYLFLNEEIDFNHYIRIIIIYNEDLRIRSKISSTESKLFTIEGFGISSKRNGISDTPEFWLDIILELEA